MKLKILFSILLGAALMACTSSHNQQGANKLLLLSPGMTKQEVIATIGKPYTKTGKGKIERYCYPLRDGSSWLIVFDENGHLNQSERKYSRC